MHIALRHIRFYRFKIAHAKLSVSLYKLLQLPFGQQKFLPRASEKSPGNIKFPVSIPCKLKIQDAAYMVFRPKDIGIMEITMTKAMACILHRERKQFFKLFQF